MTPNLPLSKKALKVWATAFDARVRRGRPVVHMLHIGKTAGTALKNRLQELNEDPASPVLFLLHRHNITLADLPPGAKYFFTVRDPILRFRSGFYSRRRQGQPRHNVPWTAAEETAFTRFPEANDLAEALTNPEDAAAQTAMRRVRHVNTAHLDWFGGKPDLPLQRHRPVAILRVDHLEEDFAQMLDRLGFADAATKAILPKDDRKAHRNTYDTTPPLTDKAREALSTWYADDIAFVTAASRAAVAQGD